MNKYFVFIILIQFLYACTYTERIKDGDTAFQRKQYAVAIPFLKKEFQSAKKSAEKGKKAFQLAESYRLIHKYSEAAGWYDISTKERYNAEAPFRLAQMYQQSELYDKAMEAFRLAGRDAGNANLFLEKIIACKQAKIWLKEQSKSIYSIKNLKFNNSFNDFSPFVFSKENLLFSSDRKESFGKKNYKWTNQKFTDLFVYDLKKDTVLLHQNLTQLKYHQGNMVISKDGEKMIFTQCGSDEPSEVDYCKLMFSQKKGSVWSEPAEILLGPTFMNYMHPALNDKGDILVFACNNKEGYGNYDLYMSIWLLAEQKWSIAKNMGNVINSKGNEVFPTFHGDTLYFSSDGLPGMGGLDLFRTYKNNEQWQIPSNLKSPMNSGSDDFGIAFDPYFESKDSIISSGYFCSNRQGGKGGDDIYKFFCSLPKIPEIDSSSLIVSVDSGNIPRQKSYKLIFKGKTFENKREKESDLNSKVLGQQSLMGVNIRIMTTDTVWSVGSDLDGNFNFEVKANENYSFFATKEGFFSAQDTISTMGIVLSDSFPEQIVEKSIYLNRVIKGKEIVLRDIKFDFDKWDIREDATVELQQLILLLKENPELNILMTSHTDCRGTERSNMTLSQKRAESTMNYLINAGIEARRLSAKGFGETTPAVTCDCNSCTEEQHQENRRTSFIIAE